MSGLFGHSPPPISWLTHPFRNQQRQPVDPMESTVPYFANAVYYPNWRVYKQQPPSSLKLGYVSHVYYAFAWLKADGSVFLSDDYADSQIIVDGSQGCLNSFVKLRQNHQHLKLILSVGGGGQGSSSFASVASDPMTRDTFARTAMELVNTYHLDGIDVDWEYPTNPQQGAHYIHLLAALRAYLPQQRYILTSALPAGEWALRNIDLSVAQTYLDFVNLMTYDFSGPWVEASGHQAQLWAPRHPHSDAASISCHSAVSYAIAQGVPSKKILLGIPAYGRSFLGARSVGQSYNGHGGEEGTFEYQHLPRPGSQEYVDDQLGAAYCVGGDGGFVTYDNPQTVRMKAKYATQNKLGGMFYWTGTADARGPRSLVETGYNALHNL